MFCVPKRTVSLRRFFLVPTTYVLVEKNFFSLHTLNFINNFYKINADQSAHIDLFNQYIFLLKHKLKTLYEVNSLYIRSVQNNENIELHTGMFSIWI